jgi:DNA-binding NarL/FixJ family response regulator
MTSPSNPHGGSTRLRVLLVDDHPLILEGIRNLLTAEGMEVVGLAHDGLEALAAARRMQPDVILMDIQMPRCDGSTATRLIKAEMPACKIVMLTMMEDDQDLFDAVKSGASGYLLKRLDADEFLNYLAELQTGHAPFSPGLAEKILREFSRAEFSPGEAGRAESARGAAAQDGTAGARSESGPQVGAAAAVPPGHSPGSEAGRGPLSDRQVQILTLVAQGRTYREVADTLGITERTVKYHMAEILERLHLENRAQGIAYAARMIAPRTALSNSEQGQGSV